MVRILRMLVLVIGLGLVKGVYGSGFAILEQSGKMMGHALAGATASAEDPSGLYFNPALIAALREPQVCIAGHAIVPSLRYREQNSIYPALGMPLRGGDGGNPGMTAFIANVYYARPVASDWVAGIGVFAPYGLQTRYAKDWIGRYNGIKTDLTTLNINPSLAWQAGERLALGFGISAQYAEAELTGAIDFGGILAAQGVPGFAPQSLDGRAQVKGDDWGYGFNLGLLYSLTSETHFGLSYRSKIAHTLKGNAHFDVPVPATVFQRAGMFVNTSGRANLDLPEVLSAGIAQRLGESLEVLADLSWTRWTCFDELRIGYGSNQRDSVTIEDWKDTWRSALGLRYFISPSWIVRTGVAYDETPIRTEKLRTPRIPDSDRRWLSIGVTYQIGADRALDFGFTHVSFADAKLDIMGQTGDNLRGQFDGHANIFSLQLNYAY